MSSEDRTLIDILVIAVGAVIAGAESGVDMELYGEQKAQWLAAFLALPRCVFDREGSLM